MTKKRNGEIDALRFFFALVIVIFHFTPFFDNGIFPWGNIGVEFFFLVSGFLLARHADALSAEHMDSARLANETWSYVVKKFLTFFRYYLCAIILQILIRYILIKHIRITSIIYAVLKSLPTLSVSFMALNNSSRALYIGNTWYLSAMMIGVAVLYPMLLKNYHRTAKIIFPLGALFLLGYLYGANDSIRAWKEFNGLTYNGIFRAIAEMALGGALYELSKVIEKSQFIKRSESQPVTKLVLTLFKIGCYLVVLFFAHSKIGGLEFKPDFDLHALLFCAIAVTMSFASVGYSIPHSMLTSYLGKISLPIFVFHGLFRGAWEDYLGTTDVSTQMLVVIILVSIIVPVLLMYVTDFIADHASKHFKER